MKLLANFRIKTKIIIIIFGIAATSTIIGNIINYFFELDNSKKVLIENTILQARLISESCWVPMEFNYKREAELVLKQLHTIPGIVDGILYQSNDSVFAEYHQGTEHVHKIPGSLENKFFEIKDNYLHIIQPVASKDVNYGYIYIRSKIDLDSIINRRIKASAIILVIVWLIVLSLAFVMQKAISDPLADLTNQMIRVAQTKDYTSQFQYKSEDEIGKLYEGFNSMLKEINKAEIDLKRAFQSLKESEIKWQFAIEGAGDGLWDWNLETKRVFISENWKLMLGYCDNEIKNDSINWEKLIHPFDYKRSLRALESHFMGETDIYNNEYRLLCKDGTYKWVLARGKVIEWSESKKALRFIGTHTDISDRKNAEEEIRQHRDELEQLVEIRTSELKKATMAAEKANSAKSSFLANMSHEIRTPMNAILGYSSILIDDESLDAKQVEYLTAINRSGHHLLSIINDILDISKIEAGKVIIHRHTFNIQQLVHDLKNIFELKAKEKSIEFKIKTDANIPQFIVADENKIRQIFTNLLSNAFKFTDNGTVELKIELEDRISPLIKATVTDTGIGIVKDYLDKIFEPFDRGLDDVAREGTGLGLAIARNFARLMNGDLTVVSEPGRGTSFVFVFPFETSVKFNQGNNNEFKINELSSGKAGLIKVLFVKDENYNTDENFVLTGVTVRFVGPKAINTAVNWSPDLVFIGSDIINHSGKEIFTELKNFKSTGKELKIVLIKDNGNNLVTEDDTCFFDEVSEESFGKNLIFKMIEKFRSILKDKENSIKELVDSYLMMTKLENEISLIPDEIKAKLIHAASIGHRRELIGQIELIDKISPFVANYLRELVKKMLFNDIIKLFKNNQTK